MQRHLTIAAKDVRPGDRIWNPPVKRSSFRSPGAWVSVKEVRKISPSSVEIRTYGYSTVKHPEEGIAVQREESRP